MTNKIMIALFPGRFQPLHKGHIHAIESAMKRFDKVIIMVGSVNKRDVNNPYSFLKRKKIITKSVLLKVSKVTRRTL